MRLSDYDGPDKNDVLTDRAARRPDQFEADRVAPTKYFAAVHDTFRRAERAAGGSVNRFYMIGGYLIQLRFAGPTLVPRVTPALEHLEVPAPHTVPGLTVCLWDSASTGVTPPQPVWAASDLRGLRGEVPGYNDERISTAIFNNFGRSVLSMLDRELGQALFWVPDDQSLPYFEIGSPLRNLLHWWLGDHGLQMVHAGAVGTPSGSALITGQSGVGKSTTTLSCLHSGLLYMGDDYVLIGTRPTACVYSLYSSGKLHPEGLGQFPQLLSAVSTHQGADNDEKALLLLYHDFGDRIRTNLPIRAIIVPRITGLARTQLRNASAAVSLMALAPSTVFQLPRAGQAAFRQIAQFVEQVPSYILELGRDIHEVPQVISQLLSELGDDRPSKSNRTEHSS